MNWYEGAWPELDYADLWAAKLHRELDTAAYGRRFYKNRRKGKGMAAHKVPVDAEALGRLLKTAKANGTTEHWVDLAIDWAQQAEALYFALEAESIRRGDQLVQMASKLHDRAKRVEELEMYGVVVAELCPEKLFNEIESEFYRRSRGE